LKLLTDTLFRGWKDWARLSIFTQYLRVLLYKC
jgi:hypothetical protein